ncbi:MAG: hypothetical protein WD737_03480 [Gemmatimonadota bacterium]
MRLSTRTHGRLDLALGGLLILLPWLSGVGPRGAAGLVPLAIAVALIANTLLTDFELGRIRRLQIPYHLWLDGLLGLLLAVSPWFLGFDPVVWLPHLGLGIALALAAFLTDTVPGYERRSDGRAVV